MHCMWQCWLYKLTTSVYMAMIVAPRCSLQPAISFCRQDGGSHLNVSSVSRQQQRGLPIGASFVDRSASSHKHAHGVRGGLSLAGQRIGQGGACAVVKEEPHTFVVAA